MSAFFLGHAHADAVPLQRLIPGCLHTSNSLPSLRHVCYKAPSNKALFVLAWRSMLPTRGFDRATSVLLVLPSVFMQSRERKDLRPQISSRGWESVPLPSNNLIYAQRFGCHILGVISFPRCMKLRNWVPADRDTGKASAARTLTQRESHQSACWPQIVSALVVFLVRRAADSLYLYACFEILIHVARYLGLRRFVF